MREAPKTGLRRLSRLLPHVVAVGGTRLQSRNGQRRMGGRDGVERQRRRRRRLQRACSPPSPGSRASRTGPRSAAAPNVPSRTSPPTPTPTPAWPSTTRPRMRIRTKRQVNTSHWCTIGGTSVASPLIASVFALAGGANGVEYPATDPVRKRRSALPASLHDVTSGSNGECLKPFNEERAKPGCTAPNRPTAAPAQTDLPGRTRLRRPHRRRHPGRHRRLPDRPLRASRQKGKPGRKTKADRRQRGRRRVWRRRAQAVPEELRSLSSSPPVRNPSGRMARPAPRTVPHRASRRSS